MALLDYSGFKLSTLAAAAQPNWTTVNDAAMEANRFWKRLKPAVPDANLRTLVSHIDQGLADGVTWKDSAEVALAAKMLLDSIDLLEGFQDVMGPILNVLILLEINYSIVSAMRAKSGASAQSGVPPPPPPPGGAASANGPVEFGVRRRRWLPSANS